MALQLLGGLGLFFYGMNRLTNALRELAAGKLSTLLRSFTRTAMRAAFFGVALTVALQSSAASTVMIVEFVNAGFLTLSQGLNVALSSSLGSYILLQVISFPIQPAAMAAVFIGALAWHFIGTPRARLFGQAFLGFGFVFIGIAYMNGSFAPLKEIPAVTDILTRLGDAPPLGILAGCVLAALLQGSAAFLAVVVSLSAQGVVTTEAALALVLGAHIGGTVTPLISSFGADRADAKRLALANTFYRLAAAVLLAPFTAPLAALTALLSFSRAGEVAVAYLLSTLFMVLFFLPLNGLLARVLRRVVPEQVKRKERRYLRYISRSALPAPLIAANQAFQETRWLGEYIFENMFELIPRAMYTAEEKWSAAIEQAEDDVEWHYVEIMRFLPELFNAAVARQEIAETNRAQKLAHEWREAARNLLPLARQARQIRQFETINPLEWQYFEDIYTMVSSLYLRTQQQLSRQTTAAAETVEADYQRLLALAEKGRQELIFGADGYTPTVNFILNAGECLCAAATRLRAIIALA
ncbi:MAG: Na/Pi symporter [Gracilibacteraceae bacterium]|jgi:phosphate:Na+ symporter|nr:Na/Pi symporter [Gracilibacteraceae bacterium]